MMFGDINILANSMPPICGENGSFAIPPGVKDTMSRITDSYLEQVKGSLIQDLYSLKFFSAPPRSMELMNSPDQMRSEHQVFTKMISKPYQKMCLL